MGRCRARWRGGPGPRPGWLAWVAVTVPEALFWVVSLVMVAAGASKLVDPSATADTLRALSVPGGAVAARLVGAAEVVVGVAALSVGGPVVAAAVAVLYAAFAGVVVLARRQGLPSCGCFGARSAPPSPVHVVVNVASAAVAAVAVVRDPRPVADALSGEGVTGLVTAAFVVLVATLVVVVDTVLAGVVEGTAALRVQNQVATQEDR